MAFTQRHLLGLEGVSADEIITMLDTAESFKEISERDIKKVPTLRGKTVINLFYEASTRTRTSFEIAAKRLSADTINISGSSSSTSKGETLADTARNFMRTLPFAAGLTLVLWTSLHAAPRGILLAVASGALASGLGYVAWYAALRHLTGTQAATVQLLGPVLAALGGIAFLGETISLRLVMSALLILGGVALAVRVRRKPAA